jgi:hypothetical protein
LVIGMVSMGQSVKSQKSALTQYLDVIKGQSYFMKTDVITQTDTLGAYTIGLDNMLDAMKHYAVIELTENTGTAGVNVKLQAKVFIDDTYTDILDVTYVGTGADTTIISDGTTANEYRFYKILLDGVSDSTFNVSSKAEIKFYR